MYTGVPMIAAVWVLTLLPASLVSLAMPKSRILARSPPATSRSGTRKMFSGLRSRWTMPRPWAACSDAATWRRIRSASSGASRPKRLRPRVEGLALEELHDDVGAAVGVVAEVEDLHDAGIGDRGRGAGLVEEPLDDVLVGRQRRLQHLDRGAASEQRVLGQVDRAHAALPELLDDAVRDKQGRFEVKIARVELPHGMVLAGAARGVELVASHASLADVRLKIPDLAAFHLEDAVAAAVPPEPRPLRQGKLAFLDAVNGELAFRLKVVLDLPVIGTRTLDQQVRVAIKDGAFDYRSLDDGLSWLEGQFVDVGIEDGRFLVGWSVPLMATKEIISWALDPAAMMLATFNRVPLRSLADFRMPGGGKKKDGGKDGRRTLRSLAISDIAIRLSMAAPRRVDVGGGAILFGGDDAPGIVDLHLTGGLAHPPGPGALTAAIGVLDLTLKDLHAGGLSATVDRLHIGPIDRIEVSFDGFRPTALTAALHRVTATNLALVLGGATP
jgi:hypothetical protein